MVDMVLFLPESIPMGFIILETLVIWL